jgi:diadenosine tetraphosphate (Ap4A) HIT family hydrolase
MNAPEFFLDARLDRDTHFLLNAPLCRIGLMDDARFPWLILVPRVPNVREWLELSRAQQAQLQFEINATGHALQKIFPEGEKLNIAALGNVVSQLHIHVVLRQSSDAAWPAPVWNSGLPLVYSATAAIELGKRLSQEIATGIFSND